MKIRKIIITAPDHARLKDMIAFGSFSAREGGDLQVLQRELGQAEIVEPDAVPSDVITMHSRARLFDVDTREPMEFTVVFPDEADPAAGKVSVLAPIGAGMLGYRVGDTFECEAPYGLLRLQVIAVTFQPEAARTGASPVPFEKFA